MSAKEGGLFLKEARQRASLTQVGLSLAAGMGEDSKQRLSLETITRLERGLIETPSLYHLSLFGVKCGFTPNQAAVAYGYWEAQGEAISVLSQAFEAAKFLDQEMQEYISQVVYSTLSAASTT